VLTYYDGMNKTRTELQRLLRMQNMIWAFHKKQEQGIAFTWAEEGEEEALSPVARANESQCQQSKISENRPVLATVGPLKVKVLEIKSSK
jgi:hypothetical protein